MKTNMPSSRNSTVTESRITTTEETMTLIQLLEHAKTTPVPSNMQVDGPILRRELHEWIRTGTLTVYEKPDRKLGETIEFQGIIFKVPKEHQGRKNIALSINLAPGSFTFEDGIITPKGVHVTENLPKEDGWYLTDAWGIPTGEEVDPSNPEARYFYRRDGKAYIGSVVRNGGYGGEYDWRYVILDNWAAGDLRVAQFEDARETGAAQDTKPREAGKLLREAEAVLEKSK
ncbi:MAG: hypothetical protein ACREBW_04170, partial [Candidatus Micrarchaeaceae archaeon]